MFSKPRQLRAPRRRRPPPAAPHQAHIVAAAAIEDTMEAPCITLAHASSAAHASLEPRRRREAAPTP